jgi:prepilin-type N-terminal cleavage/methylation domain-containing protein
MSARCATRFTTSSTTSSASRGFTLIEVLIAMGLLATLCGGVSMLLTQTLVSLDRSRQREQAMVLARAKLEQLASASPDALAASGTESVDADGAGAGAGVGVGVGSGYVRQWLIERRGSGASEMLIVQVMVTPRGGGDRAAVWISGARLRRGA